MAKSPLVPLAQLGPGVILGIANNGLHIRSKGKPTLETLRAFLNTLTDVGIGAAFSRVIPLLIEQEVAYLENGTIVVPTERTYALYQEEYGLCAFLPDVCPYWLHIENSGAIGFPEFELRYKFYSGIERVSVKRVGPFVIRSSNPYLLPRHVCQILLNLDFFGALPASARGDKVHALKFISALKTLAKSGVSFDKYLSEQRIILANTVGVDLELDESGRVTLLPVIAGVPSEKMRRAHLQLYEPQRVYEFSMEGNERLRVVTSPEVRSAIQVMNGYRHAGGEKKEQFLMDPMSVFSKAASLDAIDFGPLDNKLESESTNGDPLIDDFSASENQTNLVNLDASADGIVSHDVHIQNATADSLNSGNREDLSRGNEQRTVRDDEPILPQVDESKMRLAIPATPELESVVIELATRRQEARERNNYEIEESQIVRREIRADLLHEGDHIEGLIYEPPTSLADSIDGKVFSLQPHQKQGVAWLQHGLKLSISGGSAGMRHGSLLADDMGLGKTVQVLAFLSWCLESGVHAFGSGAGTTTKPILIIAPLVLLQVWQRELRKYFYAQGSIFQPYTLLHGDGLTKYKKADKTLDLEQLCSNKLIISNYETVKNYYHSLKEIDWSIIVIDEAQEIKDPRTNIAKCVKLLKCLFAIAVTGTPVENGLLDLWSIMEFAQPKLLGAQKDFVKENITLIDAECAKEKAQHLRSRLKFDTPETYILRRTKQGTLSGLPPKKQILRLSPISDVQSALHREIARDLQRGGADGNHLKALQRLQKIYQHPSLIYDSALGHPASHYLDSCTKLRDLVHLMYEIQRRKEKVLIFTRYIDMQLILQKVLEEDFGHFDIINGAANNKGSRPELRQQIIDDFERKSGFNCLILSPDVAGVGLTITEANNVIHYGRWWNPAREAQATDRVYRLGQTRAVNVYQMIATSLEFVTFDERLHLLLAAKSKIATDFLIPTTGMEIREKDLLDALIADVSNESNESNDVGTLFSLDELRSLSPRNLECLVAAAWRSMGYTVHMLPAAMSGSVKVIAVRLNEVRLICCDTKRDYRLDDTIRNVDESAKFLETKLATGRLSKCSFISSLVINFDIPKNAAVELRKRLNFVQETELKEIVTTQKVRIHDIFREESLRLTSFDSLLGKLSIN